MSGKEIKNYILNKDDVYYNIVVVDENKNNWKFEDIKDETNYEFIKLDDIDDNTIYEFIKMEELVIGSGMVLAYYLIK